jgi:hypothetical protein
MIKFRMYCAGLPKIRWSIIRLRKVLWQGDKRIKAEQIAKDEEFYLKDKEISELQYENERLVQEVIL